jgi:hypothetical protein
MVSWIADNNAVLCDSPLDFIQVLRMAISQAVPVDSGPEAVEQDRELLLPLLQPLQRCWQDQLLQALSSSSSNSSSSSSSESSAPMRNINELVAQELVSLQTLILCRCYKTDAAVSEGQMQQDALHCNAAAEAALQLLAGACCIWQQQLKEQQQSSRQQQQQHEASQQQQQSPAAQQQQQQQQLPLQRSQLGKWRSPPRLGADAIAAITGNAHQQQLGAVAGVYVHALRQLKAVRRQQLPDPAAVAADIAVRALLYQASAVTGVAVSRTQQQQQQSLATTPEAVQLVLQASLLLEGLSLQQQQQQQQPLSGQAAGQTLQAAAGGMKSSIPRLLTEQLKAVKLLALGGGVVSLASWPWLPLLQLRLMQVQQTKLTAQPDAADAAFKCLLHLDDTGKG